MKILKPSDQVATRLIGDTEDNTKVKRQKRRRNNRADVKDKEGGESKETEAKSSAPAKAASVPENG